MYETFFGLTEPPFDLTANPRYLFLTASHREALSNLDYGISARTGVTLLVGEAGTGKTTLIRATLDSRDRRRTAPVYLNNPTLTRSEFFEFLVRELQLADGVAASKTQFLAELERVLLHHLAAGVTPALIIDEAQSLPHELLEEVRLLANIETPTHKLLPIVLAGQPELAERLDQQSLRQLKQRIGLRCQLRALRPEETGAFIKARVAVAGGDATKLFTREAVLLIHEKSQGIPRIISVLCHNALINGLALERRSIGSDIVREVCRDFAIGEAAPPLVAAPVTPSDQSVGSKIAAFVMRRNTHATGNQTAERRLFASISPPRRRFSLF